MAKYSGKSMVFKLGSFSVPSGALVSVDWPDARDELDVTGATQDDKEFLTSERSSQITVNGWDDVAATIQAALDPTTVTATAEFYPQGNTSGKPKKSASAFITNFVRGATHNQGVTFTATLRVTGAVTHSTVA